MARSLRMILEPHMREYLDAVLKSREPPWLTVTKALKIYEKFHFMSRY